MRFSWIFASAAVFVSLSAPVGANGLTDKQIADLAMLNVTYPKICGYEIPDAIEKALRDFTLEVYSPEERDSEMMAQVMFFGATDDDYRKRFCESQRLHAKFNNWAPIPRRPARAKDTQPTPLSYTAALFSLVTYLLESRCDYTIPKRQKDFLLEVVRSELSDRETVEIAIGMIRDFEATTDRSLICQQVRGYATRLL